MQVVERTEEILSFWVSKKQENDDIYADISCYISFDWGSKNLYEAAFEKASGFGCCRYCDVVDRHYANCSGVYFGLC